MPPRTKKWSRHVHVRSGALKGWCEKCPAAQRHVALRKSVRSDGYATTVRRLNFLRNVADRRDNRGLAHAAERDLAWAKKELGSSSR
jgi:hypothetical protein